MIKIIQLVEKKTSIIIVFDIVFYKINISKNVINVVKIFVQCLHQIMILSIFANYLKTGMYENIIFMHNTCV